MAELLRRYKKRQVSSSKKDLLIEDYQLPAGYNTTTLSLIPRDPNWIYAYWEIGRDHIEYLRSKIGSGALDGSMYILRMYDVTCVDFNGSNANSWFDIEVGAQANSWHINIWCDNVTYVAELGIRTDEGRFISLARSNVVTTPPRSSPARPDVIWMEVKDEKPTQPFVNIGFQRKDMPAQAAHIKGRRVFLTEDDIRAYYSRLFPLLREVISARRRRRAFEHEILGSNIYIDRLSERRFLKRFLLGSSEELALWGGASEQIVGERQSER